MHSKNSNKGKANRSEASTRIDEAYQKLKVMIFRQNIVPGQKLIAQDLCDILNMSRTPVINALYMLEREGFIVSVPYRGFYVKPVDFQETIDLFEVREALEVQTVQLAIQRMEPGDIEKLEAAALEHKQYMPPYYDRQKIALGTYFHIQIAKIARNKTLEKLLTTNLEHEYLRFKLERADIDRMEPAVAEHYKLIERINKKDKPGSMRLIKRHVQRSKDHIIRLLQADEELTKALSERP
ncbi:MAG: GntR family transcriptional regulator [Anaerolineae bacterium]|nr:GntR family transcriptional regulator [Anaerolineae bacterium]